MQAQIQPLSSTHNLKDFDCGSEPLNNWLTQMASQQQRRDLARIFVLVDAEISSTVLGFYAIAVSEISRDALPNPNKYPQKVPVVRLGRFATDLRWQGQGYGEILLLNALERIAEIAENVGLAAVVVDAKDDKAAGYYAKFGFVPAPDNPLQLTLPLKTLLKALA